MQTFDSACGQLEADVTALYDKWIGITHAFECSAPYVMTGDMSLAIVDRQLTELIKQVVEIQAKRNSIIGGEKSHENISRISI